MSTVVPFPTCPGPTLVAADRIAEGDRIARILRRHHEIGVLIRYGVPVYYVNFPEYREAADPAALI
jgi:hypothetical protein